ncbi:MAG: aspartyl/glutamyl-tRNA amidotransferase subunit C [uncultured bacterium]|nr:MAG: aspartyl/glutamyl-tRNA amidotransferase subunit C [uncultured bacterium]
MITIKEVEHVAKLARLALNEEEKVKFAEQLGNILDYFNQLKEINTENVEPMAQAVPKINVMREDKVWPPCDREEILANAPKEEDGYFRVPRIIEE